MFLGRMLGWLVMVLAVLMASADAVMALGPAEYAGIITADVVTLLTGGEPDLGDSRTVLAMVESVLLDTPAWVVMGCLGTALLVACRKRVRRHRFRRG